MNFSSFIVLTPFLNVDTILLCGIPEFNPTHHDVLFYTADFICWSSIPVAQTDPQHKKKVCFPEQKKTAIRKHAKEVEVIKMHIHTVKRLAILH